MKPIDIAIAFLATLICSIVATYVIRKHKDVIHPIVILSFFFILLYVGKFAFVASTGQLVFSYNYLNTIESEYIAYAIQYHFLAYGLFCTGFLINRKRLPTDGIIATKRELSPWILASTGAISVFALAVAYRDIGLSEVASATGNRFAVFADQGYLLVLSSSFKVAFFLYLLSSKRLKPKRMVFTLSLASIGIDLLSGSRGKVIFENILPLLYILQLKGYWRLNLTKAMIAATATILFAISYRAATRDALMEQNSGATTIELISNAITSSAESFYSGPEAPFFDSAALILRDSQSLYLGETLFSVATYPIPRSIFADKPRGGSATLTQEYFPDYYYPNFIEIAFPFQTELLANFGIIGILAMLLAGYVAGNAYVKMQLANPFIQLILIFIAIRSVLLFRNDFFNNVTAILSVAVIAWVLFTINRVRISNNE